MEQLLDVMNLQMREMKTWTAVLLMALAWAGSLMADEPLKLVPDSSFSFKAGDELRIEVYQRRGGEVRQVEAGTFTLSEVGHTKIKGQTIKLSALNFEDALSAIESGMRRESYVIGLELKAQIVSVNGDPVVYIGGRVRRPGHVVVSGAVSVADLVDAAGGLALDGSAERVRVVHQGVTQVHDVRDSEKAGELKIEPGSILSVARSLVSDDRSMRDRLDQLNHGKPRRDRLRDGL
ncbi:SLBB domain-containing protein [Sulfuriroseicoccus oceanibius]|uniref:SLBB domain-containing protein n=1 Tax=Sulfuriroseicoccus oceanibius TaxID=2707525 RepID=A0A6B3LE25_9BACT|nr:SLBB domain-containing protein [Sulfuriroseicoccus oceanibius]QQL44767.1 SLBB domain-containing protein [Sulfuriroseicoccus oceanibius]